MAGTTITILDGNGTAQTIGTTADVNGHSTFNQTILANGVPVTTGAPMPVTGTVALGAGAAAVGSVTVTTSALPTGAATAANQTPAVAAGTSAATAMPIQGVTGGLPMPVTGTVALGAGAAAVGSVTVTTSALPTGAATAANQTPAVAAGTSAATAMPIQGVTGGLPLPVTGTVISSPKATLLAAGNTPAVTVATYANGIVVGGLITFPNAFQTAGGSSILDCINISLKTLAIAPTLYIYVFGKTMTGTYTDDTTFNLNAADVPLGLYVTSPVWGNMGSGGSFGQAFGIGGPIALAQQSSGTNLYAVMVTSGTAFVPTSTTDILNITAVLEGK